LLRRYLISELEVMHRHDIRFTAIGRLHELPEFVQRELESVIRDTGEPSRTATQPRDQLRRASGAGDAIAALVKDARERNVVIDEAAISARLYTAGMPDPDLLIRTSAKCASAIFCCGRSPTPSSTSPKLYGLISRARIAAGRFSTIKSVTAVSVVSNP